MSDVLIDGYGNCTIKTDSVRRVSTEQRVINLATYHKCAIGTSTNGTVYHWYPASRVTVIGKPLPEIKVVNVQKLRLRSRQWKQHPGLIKPVCRTHKINPLQPRGTVVCC